MRMLREAFENGELEYCEEGWEEAYLTTGFSKSEVLWYTCFSGS